MKNQVRNFLLGAAVTAVLWAPMLKAQDRVERAEVPFDFHVNNLTLPAGQYSVVMENGAVTQLRNEATSESIMFMAPGRLYDKKEPHLSFRRYGENYFLAEIWLPNGPSLALRKSSVEKEAARGGLAPTVAYVQLQRGR